MCVKLRLVALFRVYLDGLLPGFGGMSLLAYCLSAFCGQRAGSGWSGVECSESLGFADPINRAWPTQLNSTTSTVAFAFPFNYRPIVVCVGVGFNGICVEAV